MTLDVEFVFGFDDYCAQDYASDIDFSDALYARLKEIYQDSGETDLCDILEYEHLEKGLKRELKKIVKELRSDLIEVQHDNGDDCDPYTGEEYDWDELMLQINIVVPDDWDCE